MPDIWASKSLVPNEEDDGVGRPQRHLGELGEQLGDGEPVLLAQVVEQAQRVVLHHHIIRASRVEGKNVEIPSLDFFNRSVVQCFYQEQTITHSCIHSSLTLPDAR
jgi:hypothetical protein